MLSSTHSMHLFLLPSLFVLLFVSCFLYYLVLHSKFLLVFSSFAVGKIENTLLWRFHGRMRCFIATVLNSACTVAVVDSKVAKVRGNFVEDEYYQMATEFQETSLKSDISVCVCMTCNTPTPSHPSAAYDALYWQKRVLRIG